MQILKNAAAWMGFLTIVLLVSQCKKEYSYEGGTAIFSLLSANGSCTNPVLSGNYIAGTPLGSSNSVTLPVYVTNPGRYSLQTNSRAGLLFSTSGSFADTGIQTVTLPATGKPDSIGNFLFMPEMAGSCAFPVEVTGQQVINADFTLAGAPNSCTNTILKGDYIENKPLTSGNTVTVNVHVNSPGNYSLQTDVQDGISFSASGYFNQAGDQQVTLAGNGTPATPMNLHFSVQGKNSLCTFPLTVDNQGNPATYVLESGGGYCSGAIAGAYTAGIALDATNTYTTTVYVAATGYFTIATQPVNGVSFYYTGQFTTLGQQKVTLTGSGTPSVIGSFTLTPEIVGPSPIGGASCSFTMDVK
jgi:hypothetical protein